MERPVALGFLIFFLLAYRAESRPRPDEEPQTLPGESQEKTDDLAGSPYEAHFASFPEAKMLDELGNEHLKCIKNSH
jgi:hypothetical protein